ncbi:MAG: DeoR family transcriptional regulator [Chloroflexota bacterium]|nr:MAG: DeoR family transcriptional regulator [Chloroflexota bacterium]
MGKEHRLVERRQNILAALEEAGELSVEDMSVRFDVSEVTIRQDLQALSNQGLLLRTRGRAFATTVMPEFSFDVRQQQQAAQKRRIGQAAATLVTHGDTIFLDASTTAQAMIPYLKPLSELTVITNSLKAALSLLDSPQIHVILPGGQLRRESISVVGQPPDNSLEGINVQLGFFGARGVTASEGLTDVNLSEVTMKRAMVECCRRVVGVIDARKWGNVATATFAAAEQIHLLITDSDAPIAMVNEMRQRGIEVLLV